MAPMIEKWWFGAYIFGVIALSGFALGWAAAP